MDRLSLLNEIITLTFIYKSEPSLSVSKITYHHHGKNFNFSECIFHFEARLISIRRGSWEPGIRRTSSESGDQ